jgi:hypothetical protein
VLTGNWESAERSHMAFIEPGPTLLASRRDCPVVCSPLDAVVEIIDEQPPITAVSPSSISQHSPWLAFAKVPAALCVVSREAKRAACLDDKVRN